ncbi:hypothetical protein [Streptomyces sp. ME18-1-4]|jgi:hypothetical protein|uniref:hypothetical protein n=1 Tax=Streptomyces sp. ME18-1-4 TaxID=3028685 RepID=UPI0029B6D068|nr:hypothetical protein [Streptomyces sp. ME18-1-4]MDX3246207.1 hypothetical protein [Streptomyces sp. ME18-1-4]
MAETTARPTPWARWIFRTTVTTEALLAFAQPVLIGGFLQGHYASLQLHKENATFTGVTAMVMLLAAVLQWRPGRGPAWPVFASLTVVAAIVAQIIMGYSRTLAVHVPLGVLIITGDVLLLVWVWKPVRAAADDAGAPAETVAAGTGHAS